MRKVVGMLSLAGAFIAALATSGYAGQTLDRVMKNKMLVEVTDQAYPPFSFVNDKGEVEGFDIDIAKEFAKRLGVGLKVETPSWEIIVAGNWHGRFDICICSMTATKERSEVLDFVNQYYAAPATITVNADNDTIKSAADLTGKKSWLRGRVDLREVCPEAARLRAAIDRESRVSVRRTEARTIRFGRHRLPGPRTRHGQAPGRGGQRLHYRQGAGREVRR